MGARGKGSSASRPDFLLQRRKRARQRSSGASRAASELVHFALEVAKSNPHFSLHPLLAVSVFPFMPDHAAVSLRGRPANRGSFGSSDSMLHESRTERFSADIQVDLPFCDREGHFGAPREHGCNRVDEASSELIDRVILGTGYSTPELKDRAHFMKSGIGLCT